MTQGEQVTIIVYAYAGITRFSMKKALHPNLQNQTSQKIYKDHKQETVRLRTLPLVALKGFAGRKEFLVMENVKRSGIFFTPQSEVRQHLSQWPSCAGVVLLYRNIWWCQARESSSTDSCFPSCLWPANTWALLLEVFFSLVMEGRVAKSSFLKNKFP